MATVNLSPILNGWQGFSSTGVMLNGGFIYTYQAGTSTPLNTYTTIVGNVQNANPIQLGTDGRPPNEIWLVQGSGYKFVITDSALNQIATYDNIVGTNDLTINLAPAINASPNKATLANGDKFAVLDSASAFSTVTILWSSILTTLSTLYAALAGSATQAFATAALTSTSITNTGLTDISGASAGQIKFPAAQNASAEVNTLDDYEEGTFTPSNGSTSYGNQQGFYTKIGRMVNYSFTLGITTIGAGSTTAITGFPFVVYNSTGNSSTCPVIWVGSATAVAYTVGLLVVGTTQMILYSTTVATTAPTSVNVMGNASQHQASGTYITA